MGKERKQMDIICKAGGESPLKSPTGDFRIIN